MSPAEKPIYHFVFLRHGESVGNVESRWQGQSDYPLTERGRAQAHALAKRWHEEKAKFDLVITSPLIRAKNTAEIVASALDVKVESDPLWMVIGFYFCVPGRPCKACYVGKRAAISLYHMEVCLTSSCMRS
jgi:hypothetical protein